MALSFKRGAEANVSYAIIGKLPARADFIRINATHPVVQEFDDLISQGLEVAGREGVWTERYDSAASTDFFYTSRDGRWVYIGVILPSRDQAGRRYPLVAGVIVGMDMVIDALPVLPVAYELFFDELRNQLTEAVANSVEMIDCRRFLEEQIVTSKHSSADLDLARGLVERFQKTQPATVLGQLLGDAGDGKLQRVLINIGFFLELQRRFSSVSTQQAILLPLPGSDCDESLFAANWLTVYSAMAKQLMRPCRPSYFMTRVAGKPVFAIAPQAIPPKFLPALLGAPLDPLSVMDLDAESPPWQQHQLYAEVSYLMGRELQDSQISIEQITGFLQVMAGKLSKV